MVKVLRRGIVTLEKIFRRLAELPDHRLEEDYYAPFSEGIILESDFNPYCPICQRGINGEAVQFVRLTRSMDENVHYFHPDCFDLARAYAREHFRREERTTVQGGLVYTLH